MPELFNQFGIDLKLLLSQAVNFLLLLVILSFFFYRPLLKIMRERRKKIELGIKGAEMAERKIAEAEELKKKKIAAAETRALSIIKKAETEAQKSKEQILLEARKRSDALFDQAAKTAERLRLQTLQNILAEAKSLVKTAIVRTVSLKPDQVDEKLIEQALKELSRKLNS